VSDEEETTADAGHALSRTLLFREIHEQPEALGHFLQTARGEVEALAAELRTRDIRHVVVAARGTSDNAGRYAGYLLASENRLHVGLTSPSLFSLYARPPRLDGALVLGISQSGRSPDIVAVLAEARRQGASTLAITNSPGSDLAAVAEFHIDLAVGPELSVAATKTYTAELAAVALLSAVLARDARRLDELLRAPTLVKVALSTSPLVQDLAMRWKGLERAAVLARGFHLATAFEIALKLKELTYASVEPMSTADFQHGPMAVVSTGFPILAVGTSGPTLPGVVECLKLLADRGADVAVLSDDPGALSVASTPIPLPVDVPEWLAPIPAVVPGQILALHLAALRGIDVDLPRGLHKVTRTT
jgi:glucosamine--fructose-6-phosphate aminotransferase (isomerizing)